MIPAALLLITGVLLMLVAAVGLLRLRDPLQRMHSATKAGTLGATLVVIGVMLSTETTSAFTGVLAILFLLFTLPIGAQLLGRATYLSGAPLDGIGPDPIGELPPRPAPATTKADP
ncbi:monovalent cation/H(+) antiporter subunit G [Polymorphobacter sp.]|uniref:monovalent cation/H(+) antiporter subunit G n=1 Tax=Polymorphobacter sp. TaxID=1909290 RepID=UPI003F728EAD